MLTPNVHRQVWEIKTRFVRKAFKGWFIFKSNLDFSPNGRLLASASYPAAVQLWDMRHGIVKVFRTEDPCIFAQFIPGGRYVAASSWNNRVMIWDVRTGRLVRSVVVYSFPLAAMPDGKGIIVSGDDTVMKYWDISSLYTGCVDVRSQMVGPGGCNSGVEEETSLERKFIGHKVGFFIFLTQTIHCPSILKKSIYSIAISPCGRWLVSGSEDKSIRIWDIRDGSVQCIINNCGGEIYDVACSPAGNHFASRSLDEVRVWRYSDITSTP